MSGEGQFRPADDSWVVAVHASEDDDAPLGTGVVIDDHRILTCAHVVGRSTDRAWQASPAQVWVAFPNADGAGQFESVRTEKTVFPAGATRGRDVAVLHLSRPVPAGVTAAPLKCPRPASLVEGQWWAFGFPRGNSIGSAASGTVGDKLSYDWVRLDADSRYQVELGFSGGGLWSPTYRAVVGLVGKGKDGGGDGQAITLHQADRLLPEEKIGLLADQWSADQAGDVAMAAWGWSLAEDQEGTRHWRPRARGVSIDSEIGYRFRGRSAALETIRDWLDREQPDRRVLVVTGAPGAGKSAVLGRIVTTSDPETARQLPASDTGVRASAGSVACAVHAKGKTALEVAAEIARAASSAIPERIEDFAPALRETLGERGRRFNVVIDALDEAASLAQAHAIVARVILPLAETCADVGAQVIVGSRDEGDLLGAFLGAEQLVNLDDAEFFAEEDLEAYALATLQLAGAERPDNPYNDEAVAEPIAARIAKLSEGNFLVAGLTARSHGMHDATAPDKAELSFSPNVEDALREYLHRVPVPVGAEGVTTEMMLAPLAFAEAPGLPVALWSEALRALGVGDVTETVLTGFARSAAASFLLESSGGDRQDTTFRLFHQALNDALLSVRAKVADPTEDERRVTRAFAEIGRRGGWDTAPAYLLRSLPAHAARAGLASDLFTDDAYLLHANLRRLLQAVGEIPDPAGRRRARLVRLTPQALDASPAVRAAMFSVTEALDDLGTAYHDNRWQAPYRARWAATVPRSEWATCQGHQGEVNAICVVAVRGRELLASGGDDNTVRLWDPETGEQIRVLEGHEAGVNGLCVVTVSGRELLASAGSDHAVRLWDPETGDQVRVLEGYRDRVRAVCAITVGSRNLLVSGGDDSTVRLWDPKTGDQVRVLEGHRDRVRAVCVVAVRGRELLAFGGDDSTVRLWNPFGGEQIRVLEGHRAGVHALSTITVRGHELLASAGADETVRLWDPETGDQVRVLEGHQAGVNAVCVITMEGRELLASAGTDHAVRLWDPETGDQVRVLEGHRDWVRAVCAVTVRGRELLASGSDDHTVRIWGISDAERADMASGPQTQVTAVCGLTMEDRRLLASGSANGTVRLWDLETGEHIRVLEGHQSGVTAVCTLTVADRELLVSGGDDGVMKLWNPVTGEQVRMLQTRQGGVSALCAVAVQGRELLASGGASGAVRLWDPETGEQVRMLEGHQVWASAVCTVTMGNRELLASGGDDGANGAVRLWDPATGEQVRVLKGHQEWVRAVCAVVVGGRQLLASVGMDGAVRLWDPATGEQINGLEGHSPGVFAVCPVAEGHRDLLVSGGDDRTVRLWDPGSGACLAVIPTHHQTLSMAATARSLAIGLESGILVIELSEVNRG